MNKRTASCVALSALVAILQLATPTGASAQSSSALRVISEQTVGGVAFPESVAYDPRARFFTSASSSPSSIRC
jgi:hypothetical protein